MILEWRTYDFAPGDAQHYLALFQSEGLPLITVHLPLLGYWTTEIGPLNRLHHAWAYRDVDDRTARRARFLSDPDWTQGFLPRGISLIRSQASRLVAVETTSSAFDAAADAADRHHDAHPDTATSGEGWRSLWTGIDVVPPADALFAGRVIAGAPPGSRLALSATPDPTAGAPQEILRPTPWSPL